MNITGTHSVLEVLEITPRTLPIITRFGIELGSNDKTITELCEELNIDLHFFLLILNLYTNPFYFPKKELQKISPKLVVDYLWKTHKEYEFHTLPKLEHLLEIFIKNTRSKKSINLISNLYQAYKKELLIHFRGEEENVFKYVYRLVENTKIEKNKINESRYFEEHADVEEKLSDLKILIIKYLPVDYDIQSCNEFLSALYDFERDIKEHERIENLILFPQIIALEKKQLANTGKTSNHKPFDLVKGQQLTKREIEVLKLLSQGHAIKIIADRLYISEHTAISHRKNISEKIGVKSISGLTTYAIISGYIDVESIDKNDLI